MTHRFALAQMKVTLNSRRNLASIREFISRASKSKADLVLFPEYFISGPTPSGRLRKEAGLIQQIQKWAKEYKIFVVGANSEVEKGNLYNTAYLISSEGEIVGKHRKVYLMPEEIKEGFEKGNLAKVFNTKIGKLAMAVCYDSFNRFSPELMRDFRRQKAEFILVPKFSMKFEDRSIDFVRSILSAHCYWNHFYVLCSSSVGKALEIPSFGHSLVICPERGIIKEGSEEREELLVENLETDVLKRVDKKDKRWVPKKTALKNLA